MKNEMVIKIVEFFGEISEFFWSRANNPSKKYDCAMHSIALFFEKIEWYFFDFVEE